MMTPLIRFFNGITGEPVRKKEAFCFILLLFFALAEKKAFAQVSLGMLDNRGEILEGEITVEVISRSVRVDDQGDVVEKNEDRITYSTATLHRLLSTNYQHLSKDPAKLAQATEWNQNTILVREIRLDANGGQLAPPPVRASISSQTWRVCNNELVLTRKSNGKGDLTNFEVSAYIVLSLPRTPGEIAAENAARIAANTGWPKADHDETLPYDAPVSGSGLYLYTFSHINFKGGGFTRKNNISGKTSNYECSFEQWADEQDPPHISLPWQSSNIPQELKYKKTEVDGRNVFRYQNPHTSMAGMEALIKDPSTPQTFTSTDVRYNKINGSSVDDDSKGYTEMSTTTKISIRLQGKRSLTEAVMALPESFDTWLPEAGNDEKTPGNGLLVPVRIRKKDNPGEKAAHTASFKFQLLDVSKEKGICTNYPLNGTADFDLKISPEMNPLLTVSADGQSAESKEGLEESMVHISTYDWGAYGKLKITAQLSNGKQVVAYLEGDESIQFLSIPMDQNGNLVADAWEKKTGIFDQNLALLWDEDSQPGNHRRNGDGYTLYEEYRGFKTLTDRHVRTSPLKKDLFVYDPDGLVKTYYAPYNPARLQLHYIDPSMMKYTGEAKNADNRWVNFNSETHRYARQYALNVRKWTSGGDGTLGVANDGYAVPDGESKEGQVAKFVKWSDELAGYDYYNSLEQPLKHIYIVKIATAEIDRIVRSIAGNKNQDLLQQVFTKMITATVIHEVGHAIGIRHHANDDAAGVYLGVIDCAMRYNTDDEMMHPDHLRANYTFCKKGENWKRPAQRTGKNGETTYYFEDVPSDDCFGRIDIKSDP